jgi:segregation and condensation protein B
MAEPRSASAASNITGLSPNHHRLHLRMLEAMLFASAEPLPEAGIAARMPQEADVGALLSELQTAYAARGVNLHRVAGGWAFRTAEDLSFLLKRETVEQKPLSRAGLETLAIIAYHQPVTRADIENIRGVAVSKGTLDVLMEAGWVRLSGRRRTPGRPVTFSTTAGFLDHFGLDAVGDLPGLDELKAAGLLGPAPLIGADSEPGEELGAEDNDLLEGAVEEDEHDGGSEGAGEPGLP